MFAKAWGFVNMDAQVFSDMYRFWFNLLSIDFQ